MLYEVLKNAPQPSIDPPKISLGPHINGVIGYVYDSMGQLVSQHGKLIVTSQALGSAYGSPKASSSKNSTDVLTLKSTTLKNNQKLGGKNNNKKKQKNQTTLETQPNPPN